jgi:hypothetical protein
MERHIMDTGQPIRIAYPDMVLIHHGDTKTRFGIKTVIVHHGDTEALRNDFRKKLTEQIIGSAFDFSLCLCVSVVN